MVQLWETSDISAGCEVGPLDQPFFIPVLRTDLIHLRLNIPYQIITLNGGGMPIGSSVDLSIVSENGATTLCNYSTANLNKYRYGYINDSTNRIAEYQFNLALGLADEDGDNYEQYTFDIVSGEIVELYDFASGDLLYSFVYGVDDVPYPFIEWETGKICIGLSDTDYANFELQINGNTTGMSSMFTATSPTCANESGACFRFKVTIVFGSYGTLSYYTKPYKVVTCEEETVFIQSTYPSTIIDCSDQEHQAGGNSIFKNRLYSRIYGGIEKQPDEVRKSYNSRSFSYKSSRVQKFLFKSTPLPLWFADCIQTMLLGQSTKIDGVEYYQNDIESFFETNNEIIGTTYQNIYLPLYSSKCEKVFVC